MLQRFSNPDGRRFVIEALEVQPVIAGYPQLAEALYDVSEIEDWEPGSIIMEQGDPANEICFILSGSVSVLIHGREVALRDAGQHVGEMAILNPGQPKSATVIAKQEVVIACIPAAAFADHANSHPLLWRNVARSLADRLRQRNAAVQNPNSAPSVFVGCSAESLAIGETVKTRLSHANIDVHLWTDDVFRPSTFMLESLEMELARSDFAALVLAPDDAVTSRNTTMAAPRDNVAFELGLFIGALGHTRTFLISPSDADIKIPSDLAGFTPLTYSMTGGSAPYKALEPACTRLIDAITVAGPSQVRQILQERWRINPSRTGPKLDDLDLNNHGATINATVLYADLDESTKLVDQQEEVFAAQMYKTYLACAARIISSEQGNVTAYDGDRIMAVYTGRRTAERAVRTALKISYAVREIINPAIRELKPKPKPRWDVHFRGSESRCGSRAAGRWPLIAGRCGSGVSPLLSGRPDRRGSCRPSPAP